MSELYRLVYASKNLLKGSEAEMTASITQILAARSLQNLGERPRIEHQRAARSRRRSSGSSATIGTAT
jgi:hypothetical protein